MLWRRLTILAVEMKMGSVHRLPPVKRAWKTFKYRRVTPDKKEGPFSLFRLEPNINI